MGAPNSRGRGPRRAPAARLVNLWSAAEQEQAAKIDAELKDLETHRLAVLDAIVEEIFESEAAKPATTVVTPASA